MLIGLTGGIASGKSLVTAILREKGAFVICADEVSRDLVQKEMPALKSIREAFGSEVFHEDGEIDRKALGKVVFRSESDRKRLEFILHPLIFDEIFRRIGDARRAGVKDIVLDAVLLIESGLYEYVDQIWVVIASNQMERLMLRDGLQETDALARINAQMTNRQRLEFADAVIDNSYDIERTRGRVNELWNSLKGA